jgi:elongation factor G
MKEYTTKFIRNIALIGHGSAGKTTLTEAILFLSKAINRRGTVEEGNTVTDFDEEEIRRTISLTTALAPVEWGKYKINILDTPGYTDFIGEVRSALRVSDIALSVVDASAGVEVGTELTWVYADEEEIPHAVLINKMNRENANYDRALASLRETFNVQFLPLMLPIGNQEDFRGVVNILERKAYMGSQAEVAPIPADLADQVEDLYNQVVEAAVESDEVLMEKYFEEEPLTPEEIAGGLQQVIAEGSYVPVLVGAGGSELIGLSTLVDLLALITPSPDQMTFQAETAQGVEEYAISDT